VRNATNLRAYTAELQANHNIRVIANRNDFLLTAEESAWIEATFAPAHVTLFEHGATWATFLTSRATGHPGGARRLMKQKTMKKTEP